MERLTLLKARYGELTLNVENLQGQITNLETQRTQVKAELVREAQAVNVQRKAPVQPVRTVKPLKSKKRKA